MKREQRQPLSADAEAGQVVVDGQGIVATLSGPDAAATAELLARAAKEARRQLKAGAGVPPPAQTRWSDDLEA
jgi:hypothetical protein